MRYKISSLKIYPQLEFFLKQKGFSFIDEIENIGNITIQRLLNINEDVVKYLRYKIDKFYQTKSSSVTNEEKTIIIRDNLPILEKTEYNACSLMLLNLPFKIFNLLFAYGIYNINSLLELTGKDLEDILKDTYFIANTLIQLQNIIVQLNSVINEEEIKKINEYRKIIFYPIELLNLNFNFFVSLRERGIMTLDEFSNSPFFERLDNFDLKTSEAIILNIINAFKESLNLSIIPASIALSYIHGQYLEWLGLDSSGTIITSIRKRLAKTQVWSVFPIIDKQKAKKKNINTLTDMISGWFNGTLGLIEGLKLTENMTVIIKLNSIIISDLHLLDFYPLPEFG